MKSRILLLALLLAIFSTPAFSQGCSMCLSNAAASAPDTQGSLRHGIVVLLVPSLGAMVGLITLAYKERDYFEDDQDGVE